MANRRETILSLAYKLEEAGTIPTEQICERIINDLKEPIRYGALTPRWVYRVLPAKYKRPYKMKDRKWKTRPKRKTIAETQDQIIYWVKRNRNLDELEKLLRRIEKR